MTAGGASVTAAMRALVLACNCNRFGTWKFDIQWQLPLRLVAKFASSWEFCLPPDAVAVQELATQQLGIHEGAGVQPLQLVWVVVGCVVKWPPVVVEMGCIFDEAPPPCEGHSSPIDCFGDQPPWHLRVTGKHVSDVLVALLMKADGRQMLEPIISTSVTSRSLKGVENRYC